MPGPKRPESTDPDVFDFQELAHWMASRYRRREADHADLVQEGLARLVTAFSGGAEEIRDVPRYAAAALRSAMLDFYAPVREDREIPLTTEIAATLSSSSNIEVEFLVREFLDAAERNLPDLSFLILSELYSPSREVIDEALQSGGRNVRVRGSYIRRVHGIPESTWSYHVKKLRRFADQWWNPTPGGSYA